MEHFDENYKYILENDFNNTGMDADPIYVRKEDINYLQENVNDLLQEENLLITMINATPVGLIILDSDFIVKLVNSTFASYAQKNAATLTNNKLGNGFGCKYSIQSNKGCGSGETCQYCSMKGIVSYVLNTGKSVFGKEIEYTTITEENDRVMWLRINAVPVKFNGYKHVILSVDNVTESKKMKDELLKSKDFYLTLLENFPALIWRSGMDAKCNYFNKSWLDFTGRNYEDELGDGWADGVHPQDIHKCLETYQNAFRERMSFEMEYRLRRKDGEYRWIIDCGRPNYDINGEFNGYIGSCYDITEKKEEIELLNKYRLLLQKANDIILFINTDGQIIEVNKAAIDIYGYTLEEFRKLTVFDLRKNMDISIIKDNKYIVKNQSVFFNTRHFKKDGSSFPVEVSWSAVTIEDEEVILCVVRDVSEQKLFQETLEKRNNELKEALNKLKVTQGQLLQNEKLAAVGHLAAGVAHEINNPLGYIMSNIEIFEQYSAIINEDIRAYRKLMESVEQYDLIKYSNIIDNINGYEKENNIDFMMEDFQALFKDTTEGLNRIKKIVMGLRSFSRIDSQDEIIDCNLNDCIEETLIIANNEIKYYADVKKDLDNIPEVKLSGNNINQVLLNIIINAVHAIKEREDKRRGLIRITTFNDNEFVYCDIEDNGIGISEKNITKIFNPFFTTKQVGQGTGLGLSISYDIIVNLHGGDITVRSEPGISTVFTIKLPLEWRQL